MSTNNQGAATLPLPTTQPPPLSPPFPPLPLNETNYLHLVREEECDEVVVPELNRAVHRARVELLNRYSPHDGKTTWKETSI